MTCPGCHAPITLSELEPAGWVIGCETSRCTAPVEHLPTHDSPEAARAWWERAVRDYEVQQEDTNV